ncbi:MAG: hypothetical protein COA94_03715 [Rickettsiales bacterium]|nr:MAG: hypothetical protein COA94_03715 [Rickettsiales bacterium]
MSAPFKILSVLLRFLDLNDAPKPSGDMREFRMKRDFEDERLDTMGEDDNEEDYGDEDAGGQDEMQM